jgi:ElaB/YqjD/DUF883 family membrane-anchored ribosome-binding protein
MVNPQLERRRKQARKSAMAQFDETLSEAQSLLNTSVDETAEQARDVRARVLAMLATAKEKLVQMQDGATEQGKAAARFTDDYIHANPWQAIGVTAAVAFLAGILVSRR